MYISPKIAHDPANAYSFLEASIIPRMIRIIPVKMFVKDGVH